MIACCRCCFFLCLPFGIYFCIYPSVDNDWAVSWSPTFQPWLPLFCENHGVNTLYCITFWEYNIWFEGSLLLFQSYLGFRSLIAVVIVWLSITVDPPKLMIKGTSTVTSFLSPFFHCRENTNSHYPACRFVSHSNVFGGRHGCYF